MKAALLTSVLTAWGTGAAAWDVTVRIAGLRSTDGVIRVAICPRDSFTRPTCPHVGAAAAREGRVTVRGVPTGAYAVQAFHDEDGDGVLDRSGFWPSEGLGFSRDAPMRMGPPRFRDAVVEVRGSGALTVRMRYYG